MKDGKYLKIEKYYATKYFTNFQRQLRTNWSRKFLLIINVFSRVTEY